MLTVDEYGRIRRAHRDGMGIRTIAKAFHHSRRKIREVLAQPEPTPYTRSKDPPAPKLGTFHGVIEAILKADEDAPRKQRHTAMQVFRRLREEYGYTGQYDAVRRYIGRRRQRRRETFIPLDHDAGQRLECDFGHIHVDFPDGRRPVPVMVAVWSYSHAPFAIALPTERTEAILAGMTELEVAARATNALSARIKQAAFRPSSQRESNHPCGGQTNPAWRGYSNPILDWLAV